MQSADTPKHTISPELALKIRSGLLTIATLHDPLSSEHSTRVAAVATGLGKALDISEDSQEMANLQIAAVLHDIGKITIPERTINKHTKLTASEWVSVREHPAFGAKILEAFHMDDEIVQAVLHHHEHFDGLGYPDKLKGEDIPKLARILCIADVYSAMTVDRSYRPTYSAQEAMQIMQAEKYNFDPKMLKVFFKLNGKSNGHSA